MCAWTAARLKHYFKCQINRKRIDVCLSGAEWIYVYWMGMNSELERRKSFSFTYFNRPISHTQSIWYTNAERLFKQSSVVSGDYTEISAIEVTPQDDPVFATPPESLCQSLDYVQMECDVHPDSEEAFDEDTLIPPKLIASQCDSLAPPENQLVYTTIFYFVFWNARDV